MFLECIDYNLGHDINIANAVILVRIIMMMIHAFNKTKSRLYSYTTNMSNTITCQQKVDCNLAMIAEKCDKTILIISVLINKF